MPVLRLLIALLPLLAAACADAPEEAVAPAPEPAARSAPAPVAHEATGVVVSVMPNRTYVTIRHDDIPGFMDGMTMPFALADSALARDLAPGDSVAFTFAVENGQGVLRTLDLRNRPRAPGP